MTRGPLPKKAIARASDAGAVRGLVLDAAEVQESRSDLVIFRQGYTVFVRVRRTRMHFTSPADFDREYREDISRIRRVPCTQVVSREI